MAIVYCGPKTDIAHVGSCTIVALQNQLYYAEQEAAGAVAERIAADPPRALMAVISPFNVGGWNSRKRQEEGGGAACPSEFLLKREKRTTNDEHANGPTREHPSQAETTAAESSSSSAAAAATALTFSCDPPPRWL